VSRFVLDASVALAWFVDRSIDSYAVRVSQRLLRDDRALVPALWRLEVTNGFVLAERRGTLKHPEIMVAVEKFEALQACSVDYSEEVFSARRILAAARSFRLTAYDAEYLETARAHHLPLATLDQGLKQAATLAGVELLR
jgi:predicted nucleic acid-binding protein